MSRSDPSGGGGRSPEMEIRLRSGQSRSGQGMVDILVQGEHGIATEVRDTNLRFSMIITTPANRCQSRSDGSRDPIRAWQLSMVWGNQDACCACAVHSSQIASPIIGRLFCGRRFWSGAREIMEFVRTVTYWNELSSFFFSCGDGATFSSSTFHAFCDSK